MFSKSTLTALISTRNLSI